MKSKAYKNIILFLLVFSYLNVFTQDEKKLFTPEISINSSDVFFIDSITIESSSKHIPGSIYAQPVVTYEKYLVFDFRISIIVREKSNVIPMPLKVKLTSSRNVSQIYSLEEDLSTMQLEEIYNYNFNIKTNETGWFIIELISDNNFTDTETSEKYHLFDKTLVYFRS